MLTEAAARIDERSPESRKMNANLSSGGFCFSRIKLFIFHDGPSNIRHPNRAGFSFKAKWYRDTYDGMNRANMYVLPLCISSIRQLDNLIAFSGLTFWRSGRMAQRKKLKIIVLLAQILYILYYRWDI